MIPSSGQRPTKRPTNGSTTLNLDPFTLERETGFEPATFCLEGSVLSGFRRLATAIHAYLPGKNSQNTKVILKPAPLTDNKTANFSSWLLPLWLRLLANDIRYYGCLLGASFAVSWVLLGFWMGTL